MFHNSGHRGPFLGCFFKNIFCSFFSSFFCRGELNRTFPISKMIDVIGPAAHYISVGKVWWCDGVMVWWCDGVMVWCLCCVCSLCRPSQSRGLSVVSEPPGESELREPPGGRLATGVTPRVLPHTGTHWGTLLIRRPNFLSTETNFVEKISNLELEEARWRPVVPVVLLTVYIKSWCWQF